MGLTPSALAGDYLAASYFQTIDRPESREFVRKFAESLHSVEAAAVRTTPGPVSSNDTNEAGGLIILDMEVDLRPVPPRPVRDEEIVFIE